MKLSFTTLGCPDWELDLIIRRAAEYGFDAVDFRGVAGEMNIYKLPAFAESARQTRDEIRASGLEVSCFSSSVKVFSRDTIESQLLEVEAYAKLCAFFETPYIRVFGGSIKGTEREEAVQIMVRRFHELGAVAKRYGAKLLLETHDDWTSCGDVLAVMEQVDPEAVGVLWDLHHPYRMAGEQPEDTWATLGRWIQYTHVKDSIVKPESGRPFQYCLAGEGDVPLESMYRLLHRSGYEGYYTLEWEKKWHPDLQEADIAFPQYVDYMRKLA